MTTPSDLDPELAPADDDPSLDDEQLFEQKEVAGLSQMQIVRRRFLRHRGAMVSLTVLVGIIILSISSVGIGPIDGWWKWEHNSRVPLTGDGPTMSLLPSWLGGAGIMFGDHPLGVDNTVGRDMFAMTMKGVQTTFTIILIYGAIALILGVAVGALSGYFGGSWIDVVLMRVTEVFMVVPLLVLAAVGGYALKASGAVSVALMLGIVGWTGLSRLVRAEFLALREREFVDAARVAGASTTRIVFKHILPNTVGVIVVSMTLAMGAGILTEAALGFLGFGVEFPDVSLGSLVDAYKTAFSTRPWLFVWPGLFVVIIVLCLQFIGDGLRDAFDPRQKRIPKRKDLDADEQKIRGGADSLSLTGLPGATRSD